MKTYDIGANVAFKKQPHVVLATKNQGLTEEFLQSKSGKFTIANVQKFAKTGLFVGEGFDYLVGEILSTNANNEAVIGNFTNVHAGEI